MPAGVEKAGDAAGAAGDVSASRAADEARRALKSLPPFPAVALQLISLLDDPEVPMRRVVKLLRVDPAISAEILRVSNSALYGLSRRIDNLSHAIVVLGTDIVKRLALTAALGRFSRSLMRDEAMRNCWDHSVACALIAERLADLLQAPRDRAYTAGLLHDIGRLALLASFPDRYRKMLGEQPAPELDEFEAERALFGIDHCQAGEWLARQWKLPDEFVAAIADHHREPDGLSLTSIVCWSDRIAAAAGFAATARAEQLSLDEALDLLPSAQREKAHAEFASIEDTLRTSIGAFSPAKR